MSTLVPIIKFSELARRKWTDLGKTETEVQKQSGMTRRTFYRRLRNPETITLLELHQLDTVLHFTDREKVDLIDKILR